MKSEYMVSTTYAGGAKFYQVYRLRDVDKIDHSGNREVIGTFDSEEIAQEFADYKNRTEKG